MHERDLMHEKDQPGQLIDFTAGRTAYRVRRGEARSHQLVKATGILKNPDLKVVDATAGLGRDAFMIASLGVEITLIERSAKVHELLSAALKAASNSSDELAAIVERMHLLLGDAATLLPELKPDIVTVDPMHPERTTSALVKQEMRTLREIVGPDEDSAELIDTALSSAQKRVVLKWPLRASAPINLRKPTFTLSGKTVRYDVFEVANGTRTI